MVTVEKSRAMVRVTRPVARVIGSTVQAVGITVAHAKANIISVDNIQQIPVSPGTSDGTGAIGLRFAHSALPGPVAIGRAAAGKKIDTVMVEVLEPFASGVTMTIGTETAQGVVMTEVETSLQTVGLYEKTVHCEYEGTPELKAFFGGGPSGSGQAEITISFM